MTVVQGLPGRQPTGLSVASEDHDAHVSLRTNGVLVALAGSDGQSQRQLSARLGLHRNVMVSLIDTLEERGLVKRMPHPDDRRAFAVTLTDKARGLLPALEEESHAMEDEVTAALTPGERAALLDMLQRVSASLGLAQVCTPGCRSRPH